MIRINLLPQEYRRAERTSPKLFAATLGGVVAVCSVLGWFGFVYFGELARLEAIHAETTEELAQKTKAAAYHDQLVAQKKDYIQRSDTIQQIGISRKLWTREIDQLIDVVNNNGNTERHLAWFESLKVSDRGNNRGPTMDLPGEVQGERMDKVANLHEDLKVAPFFVDIAEKTPPEGQRKLDGAKAPPESMSFKLQLSYKTPGEWKKNEGIAPKNRGNQKKRGRRR